MSVWVKYLHMKGLTKSVLSDDKSISAPYGNRKELFERTKITMKKGVSNV